MIAPAAWHLNLTPREIEVCELLALGLTNKQIADELGVSHRTVEDHRANALQKLGVDNAVLLTRKVLKIDPP